MADGHIILDTRVDTTGVTKGFSAIKSGASSVLGTVGKIGAAIGIAFGVSALVKFAKQSIELSSDVQEVQNVVDVAFGDMKDQMEAFADTAIDKFGISALTAKRTGSTYMAMAKGMGIAGQEAADMALNLTGLSADMASFYNVSQKYTDIALKSVFTGETETLKQYGIVMTQTNLQEFARQKGITKSIQSMTQQEQTMLRYQYVMKQTALAQGDFVRTQNSWANQTRILSERWKEMQIVWGDAFRTIGTLILPAVNSLIKGLTKVGEYAKAAAQAIARMFGKEIDSSEETSKNIENSVENQNDLTQATEETTKAIQQQLAGFDEVNQLSKETAKNAAEAGSTGKSGSGTQISSVKVKDVKFDTKNLENQLQKLLTKFAPLTNAFKGLWEQMKKIASIEFTSLNSLWNATLKPMGEWLVNSVFAQIVSDIANGLKNSEEPLQNLNNVLGKVAAHTFDSLKWLWENILHPTVEWTVTELLPASLDTVAAAIESVDTVIEEAKPSLQWFWDNVLVPIRDFAWDVTIAFLKGLTKAFKAFTKWAKENPETVQAIADAILGFLAGLWVYNTSKKIIDFMGDLITKFKEFGGLKGMFSSIGAAINSPAVAVAALVAAALFWVKNWSKIKAAFTGMESWQKAIVIILGVAAAVAVLWTAISGGLAAATIVAGIAALGLGVGILAIGESNKKKAKANKTTKTIPSNANAYIPQKTFGEYSIPKLAQGAVLPANKPFLAQLGDQTNGRNLEAPESLLREIYSEQNQPMINILTQMLDELKKGRVMVANGREIAKTVREGEKQLGSYTGGLTFG